MSFLDALIAVVLAVSILFSLYRGFLSSFFCLLSSALAIAAAKLLNPFLISFVSHIHFIWDLIRTYTDSGTLIGDTTLASTPVQNISAATVQAIQLSLQLPEPVESILISRLIRASSAAPDPISVNAFLSQALSMMILSVLCYIVCFFLIVWAAQFLINLLNHMLHFPMLRTADHPAAAAAGLIRGAMFSLVLMLLIPIVQVFLPSDLLSVPVQSSVLYSLFSPSRLFEWILY